MKVSIQLISLINRDFDESLEEELLLLVSIQLISLINRDRSRSHESS